MNQMFLAELQGQLDAKVDFENSSSFLAGVPFFGVAEALFWREALVDLVCRGSLDCFFLVLVGGGVRIGGTASASLSVLTVSFFRVGGMTSSTLTCAAIHLRLSAFVSKWPFLSTVAYLLGNLVTPTLFLNWCGNFVVWNDAGIGIEKDKPHGRFDQST